MRIKKGDWCAVIIGLILVFCGGAHGADAKPSPDWDKAIEAAKKEGKIVLAIPPASELRR